MYKYKRDVLSYNIGGVLATETMFVKVSISFTMLFIAALELP